MICENLQIHHQGVLGEGWTLQVRGGGFQPIISHTDGRRIGLVVGLKRRPFHKGKALFRSDAESLKIATQWGKENTPKDENC